MDRFPFTVSRSPGRASAGLAALVFLLAARPAAQDPDPAFVEKVRGLIVQLKDKNLGLRKNAEDALFGLGPPALPLLRDEEAKLAPGDMKIRLVGIVRRIERKMRMDIACGNTLKVTLAAKDRPITEVFAELQKQTAVPIEHKGIPADAVTTLDVKVLSVWEAVDQICSAHGRLAWDVSEKGITIRREAYSRPILVVSSAYALIVRPFLRFPPGAGTGDRDFIRSDFEVYGPPGAVAVAQFVSYDALADDKGTNLLSTPAGLRIKPPIGEYRMMAEPDATKPLARPVSDILDAAPAKGSTKIKTCTGTATIQSVLEVERRVELRDKALAKGSRDSAFGIALELENLDVSADKARLTVAITETRMGSRREQKVFYPQARGKIVLRDKAGQPIPCEVDQLGPSVAGPPPRGGGAPKEETTRFRVLAALKEGVVLNGIEVWEATAVEEIKFPFDLKDVPLKKSK